MEAYQGGVFFLCVWGKEKKKMRKCEEGFLVLMCGEVFMEHVCARIKHGRKLCCSKYLFLSNPPLDLCQILISFSWRGVKGSPKISASLELL
jgi:hypothetical protein